MKLLLCFNCHDVQKLQYEMRKCLCGESEGAYNEDGDTAWYSGNGMLLGLNNSAVVAMILGATNETLAYRYPENNGKITVRPQTTSIAPPGAP